MAAFVLATSVTIASGLMTLRQRPARRSMSGRDAVAGPARMIRSASRRTDSAFAPATSMRPSAAASFGPFPDGDHADSRQSLVSLLARTARAIDPPIRPKPRNASCISASIAATALGGAASRSSVLPAGRVVPRGRRQLGRTAASLAAPPIGSPALRRRVDTALRLLRRLGRAGWRPRIAGWILAPDAGPPLRAAAVLL